MIKPARGTPLNQSHPLAKKLKAAWLFNEGIGGLLFDYKRRREGGTNNDGTLVSMDNVGAWVSSEKGTALNFDGVNDRVQINSNTDWQLERTDPVSFSIIVLSGTTASVNGTFISNFTTGSKGFNFFSGTDTGPFKFGFQWRNAAGNQILARTTNNFNLNQFYHVILTYNGNSNASGFTFYIDGKNEPITAQFNNLTSSMISTSQPEIGRTPIDSNRLNAFIVSLLVFNEELTSSEAQQLFGDPYIMFREDTNPAIFGDLGTGIIPFIPENLGLNQLQGLY